MLAAQNFKGVNMAKEVRPKTFSNAAAELRRLPGCGDVGQEVDSMRNCLAP